MAKPKSLVKALLKGNIAEANKLFDREIRKRIVEALNAKKVEVAKTLVVPKKG